MRGLFLCLLLIPVSSSGQQRGPILLSPMTPNEQESLILDTQKELADAGWSDSEIDEVIASYFEDSDEPPKTFHEADVLSFFPEIQESDELLYSCFVQLTSPPSQTYSYYSGPVGDNRVINTKTLDCDIEANAMFCELSTETALYLDSPTDFFFVDETIEDDEARQVAAWFRDEMGSKDVLNRISKTGEEYLLRLGRDGCACWGERTVRVRRFLFWSWLEIAESGGDVCI